jgi:hypothetical protein
MSDHPVPSRSSNRKILPKTQYHRDYNELDECYAGAHNDFETAKLVRFVRVLAGLEIPQQVQRK